MPTKIGLFGSQAIIIIVTFCFLQQVKLEPVDAKGKGELNSIRETLDKQAEAWNRGDLDSFMTAYLNSPELSYVSEGNAVWGYQNLAKRYEKKYGRDKSSMGNLSFDNLKVQSLSKDSALCIGNWHLDIKDQNSFDGVFSLVFTRAENGWKIIHDHTSCRNAK